MTAHACKHSNQQGFNFKKQTLERVKVYTPKI